jgi:hypothetical protein
MYVIVRWARLFASHRLSCDINMPNAQRSACQVQTGAGARTDPKILDCPAATAFAMVSG